MAVVFAKNKKKQSVIIVTVLYLIPNILLLRNALQTTTFDSDHIKVRITNQIQCTYKTK